MVNGQWSPALNLDAPQSDCRLLCSGFSAGQAMVNECINGQCSHALIIVHCSLFIATPEGGALWP